MARLRRFVRLIPGGAAIASLAATIKRHSDNATVTGGSVTTGPNGDFDFKTDGCPDGALYWEATSGGTTKRESGQNHGQLGAIWTDDLPYVFELFGTGVYAGYLNTMAVSAPGGMNVAVATGMAVVKGIRYGTSASTTKAVTAADPTNPRIDRVIVRVKRPTATNDAAFTTGQSVLVVLAGTPAPSPAAPALTQDANTWEISLAQVAVAAGATSIAGGNITDERTYVSAFGEALLRALIITKTAAGALTVENDAGTDHLNVNTSIGRVDLANGADLAVWADAYTDLKLFVDGATGTLGIRDGGDIQLYSDDAVTEKAALFGDSGIFRQGGAGGIIHTFGTGSPEGVVTANVGSTYARTDGGAGTSLYVKESGAGNTGWVAK